MRKNLKYSVVIISVLISLISLPSCKDFLSPDQPLSVSQEKMFTDEYEYRSVSMGLYGLQQKLAEQIVVLGELRGDLMTVTPNADADLIEINNFQPSKNNKYASPINFYKLISACNSFIGVLKEKHPEVVDKKIKEISNFDRYYGEALCMRAWAYFNAVQIYGKVPVIYESITSIEEVDKYLNSPLNYVDSIHIVYKPNGYNNDTIKNVAITLEKKFYDVDMVIRVFTKQLEEEVKAVGVNHYMDDAANANWEVTVWNTFAMNALLGQMYLTLGDYAKANSYFWDKIAKSNSTTATNFRYQLAGGTNGFALGNWQTIFQNIDVREHILTIPFSKKSNQKNDFQRLFEPYAPHQYMLKPTKAAVHMWETQWSGTVLNINQAQPALTKTIYAGTPGDFVRGYGPSYQYANSGAQMNPILVTYMLYYKSKKDYRTVASYMEGYDTIVSKYSIGKQLYDEDANLIIYRAGNIHLYLAEIYTWWAADFNKTGIIFPFMNNALDILNDGKQYDQSSSRVQVGVRGRAGLPPIAIGDDKYKMDPFTNEVVGYTSLKNNITGKQLYLEEIIMDERARELAFEGERFYDLMRVAKHRKLYLPNDDYLAKKVSAKYPSGQREAIYNLLLNENNWYIKMFD